VYALFHCFSFFAKKEVVLCFYKCRFFLIKIKIASYNLAKNYAIKTILDVFLFLNKKSTDKKSVGAFEKL